MKNNSKIVQFIFSGIFIAMFVVTVFAVIRFRDFVGNERSNVNSVTKNIGTFAVPSGFEEHDRRFGIPFLPQSRGITIASFEATDNSHVTMTLESRSSRIAPAANNAKTAFVKKASRWCVRLSMLPDDRAIVYGKSLALHQLSCVLRNSQTDIIEGASFAKRDSAGKVTITVLASGPDSLWDPEPFHALLASLR